MKILIIGSNGFVGKFLSRKLIDSGYQVAEMDVCAPDNNGRNFFLGDISSPEEIAKAARGVDAIINLAAKHHDFGVSPEEFFNVNVQGTQNILDCAAEMDIKQFIFYSTVAVYGNHKAYTTEASVTEPVSEYGKSKLAAETLINKWILEDSSRQAVILRPTVVFGQGNYANMYNLINSIYKKRFLFVGKGENIKSVAYVENLVDATIFLLERLRPGVEVYNYSDYPQLNIEQIVKTIARYIPCDLSNLRLPLRPTLAAASLFDLMG
ncbi:MAG: NAD-dependent epimerase/dehydratase family protein, partial [Omnitrophica bacterium]|nr:NAD-dependent epimerase/dehydratase family protein [Candidatus Omnitrophota bacterium]